MSVPASLDRGAGRFLSRIREITDDRGILAAISSAGEPFQAFEVAGFIGCRAGRLRLVQDHAEAVHHPVLCTMHIANALRGLVVGLADAWWPVGADLLLDGDVHPHMKEGIGGTFGELSLEGGLFVGEDGVVLRVLGHDGRNHVLQWRKQLPVAMFQPGRDEETPHGFTVVADHGAGR